MQAKTDFCKLTVASFASKQPSNKQRRSDFTEIHQKPLFQIKNKAFHGQLLLCSFFTLTASYFLCRVGFKSRSTLGQFKQHSLREPAEDFFAFYHPFTMHFDLVSLAKKVQDFYSHYFQEAVDLYVKRFIQLK